MHRMIDVDNEKAMKMEFNLIQGDFDRGGEASSKIKKMLQQLGVNPAVIRRTAVSSYEAEMNVIIHSLGGKVTAFIYPDRTELVFEDVGPGIPDIDKAMTEGFSTAPDHVREKGFGAGMGMPNISKNVDSMDVQSEVGKGTRIRLLIKH